MLALTLIFLVISSCLCAPLTDESEAVIESFDNNIDEKGNYNFRFQTSNGINRYETGDVINAGEPDEHISVRGEYSYTDPDGKLVTVRYYADDTGFHVITDSEPDEIPITVVSGGVNPAVLASLLGG